MSRHAVASGLSAQTAATVRPPVRHSKAKPSLIPDAVAAGDTAQDRKQEGDVAPPYPRTSMILKTLYLNLDRREVPVDFAYAFLKRSRCLCNYLEREVLKPAKFHAEGFNRIVVSLCKSPGENVFVNTSQVACVELPFDRTEYEGKHGDALMHYYIDRLKDGLHKCSSHVAIPLDELLQGIDDFVRAGMRNEWLHKSRTFRDHSLKASLHCSLTMEQFTLRLLVERQKELVLDEVVLLTDPDEIAYEHRFQDLAIEGGALLITSKLKEPLWKRPLEEFFLEPR